MRIVFMGTPEFAVPTLYELIRSVHEVVAVVTAPDAHAARDRKTPIQSAVKAAAITLNLPVLQPKNLKSEKFIAQLSRLNPDIQVVVAFRMLPEVVWSLPRLGTINLHASLLPKYRGAAPIHWAIINGETKTGLTTFRLSHDIDTGDIIKQVEVSILPDDDTGSLHDRMMGMGAKLVMETVQLIAEGRVTYKKQNNSEASPAPKLFFENGRLNFNRHVTEVYNFIRGFTPYPSAWCKLEGQVLKIHKCSPVVIPGSDQRPGRLTTDGKTFLHIDCLQGYIQVLEIQLEGKRKMDVKTFLNGWKAGSEIILE